MSYEIVKSNIPNVPIRICIPNSFKYRDCCVKDHFHDEIELLAVKRGKIAFTSNNKTYVVSPGEVIFVNTHVPHHTVVIEDNTYYVMVQVNFYALAQSSISKYLARFINSDKEKIVLFSSERPETRELFGFFSTINEEYYNKSKAYEIYIVANTYNILAFLYRYDVLRDAESFFNIKVVDKIMPALKYIDEHYTEQISLENVSSAVNLNPSYFCRLFKKATGSTFKEYLNFVRVCQAEKYLSLTSKSVLDISLETGFSSVSYFSAVFKQMKNCSPTVYRKVKYMQK